MKFEESISSINQFGFRWSLFQKYFCFGDTSLGEGNYQKLVIASLESLKDYKDKVRLISLLDMQAAVFLEQIWVMNEKSKQKNEVDLIQSHIASAWIQINENISRSYKLPHRDMSSLMFRLDENESLVDRLNSKLVN